MTTFELAYIAASMGLTMILGLASLRFRNRGVVTLGASPMIQGASEAELAEYRKILGNQAQASFWAMLGSGIVAMVILSIALLKVLFFPPTETATWVIGTITGLGDSALFAFFLRVWRESIKSYQDAMKV